MTRADERSPHPPFARISGIFRGTSARKSRAPEEWDTFKIHRQYFRSFPPTTVKVTYTYVCVYDYSNNNNESRLQTQNTPYSNAPERKRFFVDFFFNNFTSIEFVLFVIKYINFYHEKVLTRIREYTSILSARNREHIGVDEKHFTMFKSDFHLDKVDKK